ncbi:MAG: PQQ-dependent sugar dehydrogenase, partial [Dehalococcoidia bacterium]
MILGIGVPAAILMIVIGGGGHTSFDFEDGELTKSEPQHISGYKIETVAENLTIPWSIDWTPDGTALFTERNGNLRAIQNGELIEKPLLTLGVGAGEGGL